MQKLRQRDISNTESLISYLKNPAGGLRSAYHYTTLESLYQIFSNKTLRFSRMSKMNDVFERELFCTNRDFFFCLSKSKENENENFGMWSMYGKLNENTSDKTDKIGIKIYFPKEVLKQIKEENESLLVHSVAYADLIDNYENLKNFKVYIGSSSATIQNFDKDECSGFIKDTAWHYENEMRLRIPATAERITDKTKDIKISEEILEKLKVYPSPIYELSEVEKIFKRRCNGNNIHVNFCENRYRNSLNLSK